MAFLRRFLASLLCLVCAVILIFGTVNPLGGFWGRHFPTTIPATRARKETLFTTWNREAPIQGLILGSSRSMKQDPIVFASFTGHRYFNFAVSAGTLADVVAILDFVDTRHAPLREVVLGVDPPMVGRSTLPEELREDWELAPRVEGRRPTFPWRVGHAIMLIKESLTLSFVHEVQVSVAAALAHKEPLHEFREDGYLEYRTRDRAIAAGKYDRARAIRSCVHEYMDSLRTTHAFVAKQLATLDGILDRAHASGIAVTMWLTPFHPAFYAAADSEPQLAEWLRQVPDTLRRIAEAHGIPFVNLRTIEDFGGDADDWYDCVHPGATNAARITAHLRAAGAFEAWR